MIMPGKILRTLISIFLISLISCRQSTEPQAGKIVEPIISQFALDAWADSPRARIETWIKTITDSASAGFIPVSDRIAVFDNDGTLWPEQPVPNQAAYAFDYIKAASASHPEWKKNPVMNGVVEGNMGPLQKAGLKGLFDIVNVSHTNITTDAFSRSVRQWIDTAKDRKFNQRYKDLIYLPMVQLLKYLRANDFKTFIVSGGGADFMRVWCEEAYGIPPYQVIGSYGQLRYEMLEGKPIIMKLEGDVYVDDKAGKPAAIHRFIGKIPVFCGGNSDGDQAMMQYTSGSSYKSLCVLLHHTDDIREFAYDKKTISGHLETALDEAAAKGWMIVDMKNDFRKIFAFEK
jgi:phosphoglycolate phosphatase-like HAD superfamily hydrolase